MLDRLESSIRDRNSRFRLVALALLLLVPALEAGGGSGGETWDRAGDTPARIDESVRRAEDGQQNLVVLVGASPDGSAEERYSVRFRDVAGGTRLHGEYTLSRMMDLIVSPTRRRRPLANIYFVGHITMVPRESFEDVRPVREEEKYLGFVIGGKMHRDHAFNYLDQFVKLYDEGLEKHRLTPSDVFAPGARVAFKVCLTAYYCGDYLEKLADRMPEGTVIECYSVPYVWSTATQYPLISSVFGNFNQRYLMGEQLQGLTHIEGRWKPSSSRTGPGSRAASAPEFDGFEVR